MGRTARYWRRANKPHGRAPRRPVAALGVVLMLSIARGYSPKYLTEQVAKGRENYYTGAVAAGEPPGRWWGAGAEKLGLVGLVDDQDMSALYEHFVDPRSDEFTQPEQWQDAPTLGHSGRAYKSEEDLYAEALEREPHADAERRIELRLDAGKRAQQNLAFMDATYSVPKSITVLHAAFEAQQVATDKAGDTETAAAWRAHRQAVEDAIWAGNHAALTYLSERAGYSRVGHHGGAAGRWIDAHDLVVASFFQHDSRDHDPQLHVHNAILNRVEGADGQWRTLDSRAMHKYRGAAAVVGERTTEEHLARALGVRFAARPDGKAREIIGVPDKVMDLFSSRRRKITRKTEQYVDAFREKFEREPTALELDRLQRQATLATRKGKSSEFVDRDAWLERWNEQLQAEVGSSLAQVATDVLAQRQHAPEPEAWSAAAVLETALADVQEKKAAWTRSDLSRAVSDALPDRLGDLDGRQVTELIDSLTDQGLDLAVPLDAQRPGETALPGELRLANGESAYQAPGGRVYATPEHVHTERVLTAAAQDGSRTPTLNRERLATFDAGLREVGIELGADQAAAVNGVLTSGARVESLVGPAGTGKSFVVGAVAKAWTDPTLWGGHERRVVGLATSQVATDVLAGEGLDARNIARWLATQDRLTNNRPTEGDQQWRLRAGDLVVVDESAMADTQRLAQIHEHVSKAGAKLLLSGDHRQLAAVGAGGAMELMADNGASYELAEARRFHHEWERDASLRLRDGDETVLTTYHEQGRLLDGGALEQTEQSAARAWLADTLAGKQALLIVDRNEQAARLSAELRAELVKLGKVDEHGVPLGLQGTYAGRGDLVQARLNGWDLAGYEGNRLVPINRKNYRVLDTRDDGGLIVAPVDERGPDGEQLGEPITLPGAYVREHVALGYASTVHSAQGSTVDTSHAVITGNTNTAALYVGLSRGRESNNAHVVTRDAVAEDAPTGETLDATQRSAKAVLARAFDTEAPEVSALATAVESADETGKVRTPAELLADAAELATAGRTARMLDELVDHDLITAHERERIAAEDGATTLNRLLRRAELAGHDPREVLHDAVTAGPLAGSRQVTNVLHHRITRNRSFDPVGDTYRDWTPHVDDPQWQRYLDQLATAADTRRAELGNELLADPPQWAVDALGTPPSEPEDRDAWAQKVAAVAAHRELSGHDDPASAIGHAPKPGQVEAYASWRAAWRALGRPEADRDELEMSDGQLRVRIRAYEREKAWAPDYVGEQLAGTRQQATEQRQTAELRRAQADAATDPTEAEQLRQQATDAEALATVLDQRVEQLEEVEQARGQWYAHTAATRAAAQRAEFELRSRRAADGREEPEVTAEEWLAAQHEAQQAEDPHREITSEHELADIAEQRANDRDAFDHAPEPEAVEADTAETGVDESTAEHERADEVDDAREAEQDHARDADAAEPVAEAAVPDIREVAAEEPTREVDETPRTPSADETAATVDHAQRALAEVEARRAADARRAAEEAQAAEMARRHEADAAQAAEAQRAAERGAEPVIEQEAAGV